MKEINRSRKRNMIWVLLAISIFALFRYLFGLALPGAAFEFAFGITLIIMAGLISGKYAAKIWCNSKQQIFYKVFASLVLLTLLCLFFIGLLVNKMIGHTEFIHFFFTVICLFLANASVAMLISLVRNRIRRNKLSAQSALSLNKTAFVKEESTKNFAYFKSEGKVHKVNFEDIYYVEASRNNVKIVSLNGTITPTSTLKAIEEILPKPLFIKLHRSFIINKTKISHLKRNNVFINSTEIPISANYKASFLEELGIK